MSKMAEKFIGYYSTAAANAAQAGQVGAKYWPASDNINYADAITYLDLYHDLVTNKKYPLPDTPENIRRITGAIRKKLGITQGSKKYLGPTLTIMKINETGTNVGPELYDWLFPARIKKEEEESWLPWPGNGKDDGTGITGLFNDVKWIAFFGLAALVLVQSGVLKRFNK